MKRKYDVIIAYLIGYLILVITTVTKTNAFYRMRSSEIDLLELITNAAVLWIIFLLFVPFIKKAVQKYSFEKPDLSSPALYKNVSIHLFFAGIIVPLHAFLYLIWLSYNQHRPFLRLIEDIRGLLFTNMVFHTVADLFIYMAILVYEHILTYYSNIQKNRLKTYKLETQLSIVRLRALRMQIQPHFVFNTLHNIHSLIDEDIELAEVNLNRLKLLMKQSHENLERQLIPLEDELRFLKAYLGIEETRFQDRLKVFYEIDEQVLSALVPSMVLQPVVENAIKHGISKSLAFGIIKILAKRKNDQLIIVVEDNGPGMASSKKPEFGIGIMNTLNRLDIMFDEHDYEFGSSNLGGVCVSIKIPFIKNHELETT